MTKKDKSTDEDALRTRHFVDIERSKGETPGAKEMAMTKKPRSAEKEGDRTKHFIDIEKGKQV
jgi:hypothetical protein